MRGELSEEIVGIISENLVVYRIRKKRHGGRRLFHYFHYTLERELQYLFMGEMKGSKIMRSLNE